MRIIVKPFGIVVLMVLLAGGVAFNFFAKFKRTEGMPTSTVSAAAADRESAESGPIKPVSLDPRSVVQNPSFEEVEGSKKPAIWNVDLAGDNAINVAYVESKRGAHSGHLQLTHYGGSDYDVRTTQKLTRLKNGKYTLRLWARNNAGRNESYLVAKDFGDGETRKDAIIPRSDNWVRVQVSDIEVTRGECVVGIYSKAEGGAWTQVDDVEFIPQN